MDVTLNEVPLLSIYSINEDSKKRYFIIPTNGNHKEISQSEYESIVESKLKLIKQ